MTLMQMREYQEALAGLYRSGEWLGKGTPQPLAKSAKPPPGYVYAGHHGGAKNVQGQWWYPSAKHAYAHGRALYDQGRQGPEQRARYTAEADAAYEHGRQIATTESHADYHAHFDAHVAGPLRAATDRFVAATKAHQAALAEWAESGPRGAADSALETAGRHLEAMQEEAKNVNPYAMDIGVTHTPEDADSEMDDWHLGADHPEVHAARSWLQDAEIEVDDDDELMGDYAAHVRGPLREATEAYARARTQHAAQVHGAQARVKESEAAWQDAGEDLQTQQEIAEGLAEYWPDEARPHDLSENKLDTGWGLDEVDPNLHIDEPQAFLRQAEAVKAAAHAATRAKGIDMDTLVNPPEPEDEEDRDNDEEEDVPMSKSMTLNRMSDLRRRIKALSKGKVRTHERHLASGKVVTVSEHSTRRTPTFRDHRGASDVARTIHETLAKHGPSDMRAVHGHVARELGRSVSHLDFSEAMDELGHVHGRAGKRGTTIALHPAHPDEKARRARERVEGPPRREAKAKQAAADREERQSRMDASRAERAKSKEEAPARRRAAIDSAVARGRERGFEPGKRHPSSRKKPAAEPSDLAQHLHRTIEEHGSLDERALHQHVARARGEAISHAELDSAMGELGRNVVRHMTRNGRVKVKLRKAAPGDPLAEALRALEALASG